MLMVRSSRRSIEVKPKNFGLNPTAHSVFSSSSYISRKGQLPRIRRHRIGTRKRQGVGGLRAGVEFRQGYLVYSVLNGREG